MGREETALIVFGFGGLGVLLAFIVERLYINGIIIDDWLTRIGASSTITELQAIIVVVFMLLGVVIAATR